MLNSHCLVEEFIIGRLLFLYLFTIGLPWKMVLKKKCVCLSVIPVLTQFSERQGGNFPRGSSVQRKRKQKVDWKNHSVGRVFKCLLLRGQLSAEWFSDVTVQGLLSQNTSSFNFVFRP